MRQDEDRRAYRCGCVTEARQTVFGCLSNGPRQNKHDLSQVGTSRRIHLPFVFLTLPYSIIW